MKNLIFSLLTIFLSMTLSACSDAAPADQIADIALPESVTAGVVSAETSMTSEEEESATVSMESPMFTATASTKSTSTPKEDETMKIKVSDGQNTVIFQLNDTPAARSLYEQLPQTLPVDNYGSNEKIFYPPDALDTTDAIEGGGPAGGLAYFSPWGNVVMYYGPFGQYPGLYLLGEAVSGGDQIGQLTGTITVEQEVDGPFDDVPANAWYADAAAYCQENNLISGVGNRTFAPNTPMSRAMLVTILWRMEGRPAAEKSSFQDVKPGSYYEKAVNWAASQNIVAGYSKEQFGPNDNISREQFAAILYRYAKQKNPDLQEGGALTFADASDISRYAQPAVSWAKDSDVISGKPGNRFDPKGLATRAEGAVMLYRYLTADRQDEESASDPELAAEPNVPSAPSPTEERPETAEPFKTTYEIQETEFRRDGKKIYAELYLPQRQAASAIVIIAHGFGGNLTQVSAYSRAFAESGIAVCAFDFIGGGRGSRSDGSMTEMSVLTEAADLNAVIDGIKGREDLNFTDIFLLGGSQGGFVASYVAGKRPNDIQGLVALYPAYVLQDDARSRTPDPENIPETMNLMGMTIGRVYNVDAMSFDIYDVIPNYRGEVLVIHGTNDTIAPISYSEKAVKVFPSAELVKIEGAGHGFYGDTETYSAQLAVDFVKEHLSE